jgi:hypothetical protein
VTNFACKSRDTVSISSFTLTSPWLI